MSMLESGMQFLTEAVNHPTVSSASAFISQSPYNPQPYFQSAWESMCENYTEQQIAVFGSLAVQVGFFFGGSIPAFVYQFIDYMRNWKVQKNRQHTLGEQFHCLVRVIMSKTFIYAPLIAFLVWVLRKLDRTVPIDYASMPAWYIMVPRMVFCLMAEDTWHYWAHRALHIKSLYPLVHKIHHTFNTPFAMAAEYAHPIETIVLGIGFFIPLIFVCDHLFVFWCWLAVRMIQTTDAHQGFYFPWFNPLYLLPFYGGVRFHDFHHYYFNANYASTFTFWDWLCGTDTPYIEHEKKRLEQEQSKKVD